MPIPTILGVNLPEGSTIRDLFYTGKLNGGGAACAVDLTVGSIVQTDSENTDSNGVLNTVSGPVTAQNGQFWVVTGVPATSKRGGPVQCALVEPGAKLYARCSGTLTKGVTRVGVVSATASALAYLEPKSPSTVAHLLVSNAATTVAARSIGTSLATVASGASLSLVEFGD